MNLSERFHGLTPFSIRRTPAREVFLLIRRLARHNELEETKKIGPNRVIRRKAGDDWF